MHYLLLFTIFVISTCGLIYELVAGTLASYLLGDSVTQFSTVIGTYLFAMGIGSYLSKFLRKNLIEHFIRIEVITGVIGGLSSAVLFISFGYSGYFRIILYGMVFLTGVFVGLEIPLIMRILKNKVGFRDLVSKVFTFDYIGALIASIAFPMVLVPYLNLTRTSVLFGLFNIGLALYLIYYFRKELKSPTLLFIQASGAALLLIFAFVYAGRINRISETEIYGESIIYATNSKYQRIVLTRDRNAYSLFLNNHLQFNSRDEYRYHEALVHPVLSHCRKPKNVLVLGGGDGFAVREILKYPQVEHITLVDLDPRLVSIFSTNELMTKLNNNSLNNPKLKVIQADAFEWLRNKATEKYDAIIIDFPDPSNFSVGKLYTLSFYKSLQRVMTNRTLAVMQSTSPLYAKESFWCINSTIEASYLQTIPYHTYVPSFGEWGYILFAYDLNELKSYPLPKKLKYYSNEEFKSMKFFPPDMRDAKKVVNRLDNQALIPLFEKEWDSLFD